MSDDSPTEFDIVLARIARRIEEDIDREFGQHVKDWMSPDVQHKKRFLAYVERCFDANAQYLLDLILNYETARNNYEPLLRRVKVYLLDGTKDIAKSFSDSEVVRADFLSDATFLLNGRYANWKSEGLKRARQFEPYDPLALVDDETTATQEPSQIVKRHT